jgi:hypothetical protein
MKHNKFLFPVIASTIILTSCGLGDVITKEDFSARISNLTEVSYRTVTINGTLSTRFAEVEANIGINYTYTFENGAFVPNISNDISTMFINTLAPVIESDFAKSTASENAVYYMQGDTGFAMSFSLGNPDTITKSAGEYTYQYNKNGYYNHVVEKETYIESGLTYTSYLELSYSWTI